MGFERNRKLNPYYQHQGITLYHGDCREILPNLGAADVVLTDPPWHLTTDLVQGCLRARELWAETVPHLSAKRLLVWHAANQDPRIFLDPLQDWEYLRTIFVRRAIPGYYGRALMDGEIVHALGEWPKSEAGRRVFPGWISVTYRKDDRHNGHPAPRSLIATKHLLARWSAPGETVLDPFAGSGTTLRAAKDLNRSAIGIEIEEPFCEIIAERLAQEVFQFE